MSNEEIQTENEQKKAEIKKAVKEANGLILNDGPFRSLKEDDARKIEMLKSLAADEIHVSEDWDFLSKVHRIYYSCPMKFNLTKTPYGTSLPEGETLSRGHFPVEGGAPRGNVNKHSKSIVDFKPVFEKIPDRDLDARFKDFDNAMVEKMAGIAEKNNKRQLSWRRGMESCLTLDPLLLMSPSTLETVVDELLKTYIIFPNRTTLRQAGLDVRYSVTPDIPSLRPDLVFQVGKEASAHQLQPEAGAEFISTRFESSATETLVVCEFKRRGLSRMIENGEIKDSLALRSNLRQCLVYILGCNTDVFLLTDFETSILFELNFPESLKKNVKKRKFEGGEGPSTKRRDTTHGQVPVTDAPKQSGEKKKEPEVPLRYRIIDIEETKYTLQAVLGSTVYSKVNASDESKKRCKDQIAALHDTVVKPSEVIPGSEKHQKQDNKTTKRQPKKTKKP